ncbi:MAG: dehydrogenase [Spirochaetaceae bacterium]|nr:dehydrogenase [Spirochaetaceae bacterium]
MNRNLIIIGGGPLQLPLIQTALDMNINPVVFDMDAEAPGRVIAHRFVQMSTRDIDGCVREAKKLSQEMSIHGAITAGTDASRAVSAIAAALDLPGIRYSDAEAASNKVLMRKRLRKAGVPVPDFFPVWNLKEARDGLDELGCPAVLKPAENMGARGVIKIRDRSELVAAYRHAKKHSTTGEMILEQYMEGPELSVDALTFNGEFWITGVADRIIDKEPFFIERGHNMPSAMDASILQEVERVMIAGMKALGIHTGAGKGDIKVTPQGVKIGELAARLSGGWMSSHTYPIHSGVQLYRAAIEIATGQRPTNLKPNRNRIVIERGLFSPPGRIISLSGDQAMRQVPGVEEVILTKKPGQIMQELTSNIDKVGHVICSGETLADAEFVAAQAMRLFELEVDETAGVDWAVVEERARERLSDQVCWVCKVCDGQNCASGIPGMGGIGSQKSFQDNSVALAEWRIVPNYVRQPVQVDTGIELFGRHLEHPILGAPMTGAGTNLKEAMSEFDLALGMLRSYREAGSVAFLGDGASLNKFPIIMEALENEEGFGVLICKPRADTNEIIRRIRRASEIGVLAVGMDIDALAFKTLHLRGQRGLARPAEDIARIREASQLPFILKGILNPDDAKAAARAGVDYIVVSNHGGRVLEEAPGSARVLTEVKKAWLDAGGKPDGVLVDGGVRSGSDTFKYLNLGASAVLVGRPSVIALAGGGQAALRYLIHAYSRELRDTMDLCGTETVASIARSRVLQLAVNGDSTDGAGLSKKS